ncbi:MAG TPA: IS110 family transposase [Terriglobia bacterium]|nr:IS110 family transposase [Terriglobia bacterium]
MDSQELVCAMQRAGQRLPLASFANTAAGHKKFIRWATKGGRPARVGLEATGIYSLEFALALHHAKNVEVMVVNPRAIKDFARACMQRAKTDAVDAGGILEFLERMPFTAWQPPAAEILELQAISRRIDQLQTEITREKNRRHAAEFAGASADAIAHDIEINIHHLERRLERMQQRGRQLVHVTPALAAKLAHLVSAKGIGEASAMRILAELLVLPDDLAAPQWVAHAGLDPRPYESGTSIHRPRRISKVGNRHLRAALYMPALVAIQHEPNVKAFYNKLIAAGKKPMQAVVAVMRKLLHAIWGMLKHDQDFDGNRFFKLAEKTA